MCFCICLYVFMCVFFCTFKEKRIKEKKERKLYKERNTYIYIYIYTKKKTGDELLLRLSAPPQKQINPRGLAGGDLWLHSTAVVLVWFFCVCSCDGGGFYTCCLLRLAQLRSTRVLFHLNFTEFHGI